jgi:hypothetical protein
MGSRIKRRRWVSGDWIEMLSALEPSRPSERSGR